MNNLRVKWYGTAAILIEQNGTNLLFDPFLPLSKKVFQPSMDEFITADGIFITHDHYDHISAIPEIIERSIKPLNIYCSERAQDILVSKGKSSSRICCIAPGDNIGLGPFEIRVLKSEHIVFNTGLIVKALLNPRILYYWKNLRQMLNTGDKSDIEMETFAFDICVLNKRIFLMGSLNLDAETEYMPGADLLILPFQGRTDISSYAMPIVKRLQPKKILLDHFDDTFPPLTSSVDTNRFIVLMQKECPDIPVICTGASAEWIDF